MQYLVQLRLSSSVRSMTKKNGIAFIEENIFPTLELCKKLQGERKIVGGGPVSGTLGLALIINAESAQELDDLITSLPVWPQMETDVIPLTTFDARRQSVLRLLDKLKAQVIESGMSASGGGR